MAPASPATLMIDGYGEATPAAGMTMAVEFETETVANDWEPIVTRKLVLELSCPSLTVREIVELPNWLGAAFTVTVRLAPEPPKTTFAFGTSVGFEEVPVTV